jgi:hypothetical protein
VSDNLLHHYLSFFADLLSGRQPAPPKAAAEGDQSRRLGGQYRGGQKIKENETNELTLPRLLVLEVVRSLKPTHSPPLG